MKRHVEFSKKLMFAVMVTYFMAFALGCHVVIHAPSELGAFLMFVGSAIGIALSCYAIKSGAENLAKINKGGDGRDQERNPDRNSHRGRV